VVASRNRRNTLWYSVLLVVMVSFGFVLIGYWQTMDLECAYAREFSFTRFPPQYVCRTF
jgi:hypothetical protein